MGDQKLEGGKFWAKDPCALFADWRIFPTTGMSQGEKLNAVTRLAIIIALILFLCDYAHWFTFLILAVLIILLISIMWDKDGDKDGMTGEHDETKEGFTVTPTYMNLDLQQTSVTPLFSEEYQIYSPSYDVYDSIPAPVTFEEPMSPQSYPYAQVLSDTNLLPSDDFYVKQMGGSVREAREFANDNWTRQSLAFRDNMTRIMKDRLARRFRSNAQDVLSPFNSY